MTHLASSHFVVRIGVAFALVISLSRCSDSNGNPEGDASVDGGTPEGDASVDGGTPDAGEPQYAVAGTVSGLGGGTVVLSNSGGDLLTLSADGAFEFGTRLASGQGYDVAVATQPSNRNCTVSRGQGTVADADISDISVVCVPSYALSGSVSGLSGGVLQLRNGDETIAITESGPFAFAGRLAEGAGYDVSVQTSPTVPDQLCIVENGTGAVATVDITNVAVTCVRAFRVGGTASGLTDSVRVSNNGESQTIAADGSYRFSTPVVAGGSYDVSVAAHPATQTCYLNGSADALATVAGVIDADDVTVDVQCETIADSVTPVEEFITADADVVVRFNREMDPSSLQVTGTLGGEATPTWTSDSFPNDTLTLVGAPSWSTGVGQTLVIAVADIIGRDTTFNHSYNIFAELFYVSSSAAPGGDGLTPATPLAQIAPAATLAQGESKPGAILVAEGDYQHTSLTLAPEVSLFGRFRSDFSRRDAGRGRIAGSFLIRPNGIADQAISGFEIAPVSLESATGPIQIVPTGPATTAGPTVEDCVLRGGFAVVNIGGGSHDISPTIARNTIIAADSRASSTGGVGVFSTATGSGTPRIHNNVFIIAEDVATGVGTNDSAAIIRNNTMVSAGSRQLSGAVSVQDADGTVVENNIFAVQGSFSTCVIVRGTEMPSVQTNLFFGCSRFVNQIPEGEALPFITTIEDTNALPGFGDNVSADPGFVDADGPDDNPLAVEDNDYHLSASAPDSVTTGGLNGNNASGWAFADDLEGEQRPAAGSGGWSLGAHQL